MTIQEPFNEAEGLVRALATQLTTPRPGECLLCFTHRQLDEFGCDTTLRFAQWFRDLVAPKATALEDRLGQVGGFCDCECFLNGYTLAAEFWTPGYEIEDEGQFEEIDPEPPAVLPACAQVRRGSTQPCKNWVRRRRGW